MKEIQPKKKGVPGFKSGTRNFSIFPQEMEKSWGMFWFNSPQQHVSHEVSGQNIGSVELETGHSTWRIIPGRTDTWVITMVIVVVP